jgi:hypothetical protein
MACLYRRGLKRFLSEEMRIDFADGIPRSIQGVKDTRASLVDGL